MICVITSENSNFIGPGVGPYVGPSGRAMKQLDSAGLAFDTYDTALK